MSRQLKFGDWSFDADGDVLSNAGSTIRLEPQVAKLLEYLLAHQGQLLDRELLLRDVWGGRVVTDDAIHRCIGILRHTLAPHDKQAFIRTVPKKGYIASFPPVRPIDSAIDEPRREPWRNNRAWTAAALFVAVLALPFAFDVAGLRERASTDPPVDIAPAGLAVKATSIAVLPFVDLSPEQNQAYFADGVAEEILTLLAQIPDLRVIARTSSFSFRDRKTDIATIADTLNASHVLEGSLRKSGNRVRIVVQLVDATNSAHLWSDSYDRELGDILAVQAEIAGSVAAALKVNLGLGTAVHTADLSVDPQAFDAYLRGLQQVQSWTHSSLGDAEKSFAESIRRDPQFVRAYYGLGIALVLQVVHEVAPLREILPRLRDVVTSGLQLMPEHPGLIALEGQVARYDGNIDMAEQYLEQAMMLDPADTWIRNLYCFLKMDQGEPDVAVRTQQRTLEIDPLNPAVYIAIGFSELDLWNTEEALAATERFVHLNLPGNETSLAMNGVMKIVLRGDYADTVRTTMQGIDTLPESEKVWTMADLAIGYYTMEDMTNGAFWLERTREVALPSEAWLIRSVEAYGIAIEGNVEPFRALRANRLINNYDFKRVEDLDMYLLVDYLLERNEAPRAVALMLDIAPEWGEYKRQSKLPAETFYPASALVKSGYSSYPAMHFVPFIRALRAAGDRAGADIMLTHLETILESRRERGLFVEEIHVAEDRALRGDWDAALDALEQAERDRTVYLWWQLRLLHSGIFQQIRNRPRFTALIERIRAEMSRQRAELETSLVADDRQN